MKITINGKLTLSDVGAAKKAFEDIQALVPFAINLTPLERKELASTGDKTLAFVQKGVNYSDQKPHLLPGYLPQKEFEAKYKLYQILVDLLQISRSISEELDDTSLALGAELYRTSRIFYQNLGIAAQDNEPGATVMYQDMAKRYDHKTPVFTTEEVDTESGNDSPFLLEDTPTENDASNPSSESETSQDDDVGSSAVA